MQRRSNRFRTPGGSADGWWSFILVGGVMAIGVLVLVGIVVLEHHNSRDDKFDYVVVGGGAAGSLVAEYLSRDSRNRVLLLEAGGDYAGDEAIDIVVHNTKHVQRDHYAQYFWQQGQEQNEVLPPDANHSYTTGRLLGGESAVGDARYNRGTAEFYDIIAALTEDTIWNSTNMLEIFRELETYWPADNTSFFSRGHEGLLNVVEQGIVTDMASKLVAAFSALTELPALNDYNATSELGPFTRWQNMIFGDAERMSADKVFLTEEVRERSNLVIRLHCTVTKVLFTSHKEAYGVSYLENGLYREAYGRERIILTAGVNSPVILQHSGVGDADYLDAVEVEVVHNNTNVGVTVYNHNGIVIRFHKNSTDEPSPYNSDLYEGGAWLPNPVDPIERDLLSDDYRTARRVQAAAINLGDYMDLEFFSLQPRQSGYVTVRDNDPLRAPQSSDRIFMGEDGVYEENFYIDTIRDYGCALTDIFTGEDSAPIDPEYYMIDPPYFMCGDTSGLRQWIRGRATVQAHDWVGSNRMGTTEDGTSVCNSKGSVHGVTRLTIADKSVLPQINNGVGIAVEYGVAHAV